MLVSPTAIDLEIDLVASSTISTIRKVSSDFDLPYLQIELLGLNQLGFSFKNLKSLIIDEADRIVRNSAPSAGVY